MKISTECRALLEPIASVASGIVVDRRAGEVLGAYARSTASAAAARAAGDARAWGEVTAAHLSTIDAWNDDARVCIEAGSVAMFFGRVTASSFLLVAFEPTAPRGLVRLHGQRLCEQLRVLPELAAAPTTAPRSPPATDARPPATAGATPQPSSVSEPAAAAPSPAPPVESKAPPSRSIDEHALEFLESSLIASQTEVFGAELQRAMADAIGRTEASAVETLAWHQASYQLLRALAVAKPHRTAAARLTDAADVFASLGLGVLEFAVDRSGGEAHGDRLSQAARAAGNADGPVDTIAAGFCAAATEVAFDRTPGAIAVDEIECVAAGAARCRFVLQDDTSMFGTRGVVPMAAEDTLATPARGLLGDEIEQLAARVRADAATGGGRRIRGLADAVSRMVAEVAERLASDDDRREAFSRAVARAFAIDRLLATARMLPVTEGGSGHSTAQLIANVVATARADGYGSVGIESHDAASRVVLTCPGTPLGLYGRLIAEGAPTSTSPDLIGIAMAALVLAKMGDATSSMDAEVATVAIDGARFSVEQTSCFGAGDSHDRVAVTLQRSTFVG